MGSITYLLVLRGEGLIKHRIFIRVERKLRNWNKVVADTMSGQNRPTQKLKGEKLMGVYTKEVRFTKTGQYGCGPENEDDVYTVEEFKDFCKKLLFVDYDGFGYPVKDKKSDITITIVPSRIEEIPEDATHIIWFNR